MYRNKNIFIELTKLGKMTLSSPGIYHRVHDITFLAFYNKKPLFTIEQKPTSAILIEKSLPLIDEAYELFHRSMIPDLRQNAQISRSGLQYLIDEYEDNSETYQKLNPVFNSPGVKLIELSIEFHTGIPPEYSEDIEMDLSEIPPSHFWWFFTDDDDE